LFFENSFSGILQETASLNRYSYGHNNPNKFRDPSGNYVESGWDILSLGVGVASFAYNIKEGNYGAAGLDAFGIVVDTVALAVPILPGGAGVIIKASRAVQTTVKGLQTVDRSINAGMAVANAYVEYTQGNYGWAALNAGFAALGAKGAYESAKGVRAAWKTTTAVPDPLKTVQRQGEQIAEVIGEGNDEVADLVKPVRAIGAEDVSFHGGGTQLGNRFIGAGKSAGAIDDPLIDNNILAHLARGDEKAVRFAQKYKGLLSIDDTVALEFMNGGRLAGLPGRTASDLDDLMAKYGMELRKGATEAEALAVVKARKGTVVKPDDYIVAVAKRDKIRFATGDRGALKTAIQNQVDVRYWNFENGNISTRYLGFIKHLKNKGLDPRYYLGPLNPW
jgi:hypothetical protein